MDSCESASRAATTSERTQGRDSNFRRLVNGGTPTKLTAFPPSDKHLEGEGTYALQSLSVRRLDLRSIGRTPLTSALSQFVQQSSLLALSESIAGLKNHDETYRLTFPFMTSEHRPILVFPAQAVVRITVGIPYWAFTPIFHSHFSRHSLLRIVTFPLP